MAEEEVPAALPKVWGQQPHDLGMPHPEGATPEAEGHQGATQQPKEEEGAPRRELGPDFGREIEKKKKSEGNKPQAGEAAAWTFVQVAAT